MSGKYDAGLLSDYGGGNVEWWQDYLRAEIEKCNDFHGAALVTLQKELDAERGKVIAAKKLCDAVWEWHKNVSIWYDPKHPYLTVSVEVANKIFQARVDFDNLKGGGE